MKFRALAARAGGIQLFARRVRLAQAQIVLDRAVKQVGVLVDRGNPRAQVVARHVAKIHAVDPHGAPQGIVEAQQKARDRRLSGARTSDDRDPLAPGHRKRETRVHRFPLTRIGEADIVEFERGTVGRVRRRARTGRLRHRRPGFENAHDRLGRRLAHHAGIELRAHVAQRAEQFDAHHQDDQKRCEFHLAGLDAPGADGERRGRADGDRGVGHAAAQRACRVDPHRAAGEVRGPPGEDPAPGPALPEHLECRQPLHRVEELRRERRVGPRAFQARTAIQMDQRRRKNQRDQRRRDQDRGDGQVEKGHEAEDADRGEDRDQQGRKELTEIDLELLDAVARGKGHVAGPFAAEPCRTERDHLVVDRPAYRELNLRGRPVRNHDPRELEKTAQHDHRSDQRERPRQGVEIRPLENKRDQPAQQGQPGNAGGRGRESENDGKGEPAAHAQRERPEPGVRIHD